jgi:signal transduction histidine kinase
MQVTNSRESARFTHSIGQTQRTLENGLNTYLTLLDSVRAFAVAKIPMTATQFHAFGEALDLRANYPGIDGLGIAIKINPSQQSELVQKARGEGLPEFKIWPPSDQPELCPLIALEPRDQRNLAPLGFDLFTDPSRRAAAALAAEEAAPIATAIIAGDRKAEPNANKTFSILVPVYKRGGKPATIEERRATIAGYVYCAFRTRELLRATVGGDLNSATGLRVYDGPTISEQGIIYESAGWPTGSKAPRFAATNSIIVAGRPWTLAFASNPNNVNPAPITLLCGLIVSGMLWGITKSQSRAREAAERHTAELQKSEAALEQRVVDRTAQLELAMEEMKAFSYTVSHDLRAPLRHIGGYVSLLRENPNIAGDAEAQRYAETISKSATQMGLLIDGLLNFARIGWTSLSVAKNVDVNEIVRDVRQMLTPIAGGRVIEWRVANLPNVNADRTLLQQVFANLISNAVKYSSPKSPAIIEIGGQDGQKETTFFVRDNGVGFDMKYADKLFNVFQRLHTSAEFEGTGIGLANIRKIVSRHGGRVWAQSEPGHGATFYFTLPKD